MDLAQDNVGLSDTDAETVFKYAPRESTVIKMMGSDSNQAIVSILESDADWRAWIHDNHPRANGADDSGLMLLLLRREGESSTERVIDMPLNEWQQCLSDGVPSASYVRKATTFSTLSEKRQPAPDSSTQATVGSSRRSLRTLPFSQKTFKLITQSFYTHGSIAKVISRSDVPVFFCEETIMEDPAFVYNFRSSNAWAGDLALSTTYFPNSGLTFAILYGCSLLAEKEVLRRLSLVNNTVPHPLLLPGIFVELERLRHSKLVTAMSVKLESRILQFRFDPDDLERPAGVEADDRNQEKRTAFLDTAYLRNGLTTWMAQLDKMIDHIQELGSYEQTLRNAYQGCEPPDLPLSSNEANKETQTHEIYTTDTEREGVPQDDWIHLGQDVLGISSQKGNLEIETESGFLQSSHQGPHTSGLFQTDGERKSEQEGGLSYSYWEQQQRISSQQGNPTGANRNGRTRKISTEMKMKRRLLAIRDEYGDWVRDCTMRVDGLAMAAQWTQGETNIEIALSTRQDSRYMRSIAVLTMIFLPGTWVASVFSMTFFDWQPESGGANISAYIWIYVVITVFLTVMTLGCWYFVAIYRPQKLALEFFKEE